MRCSVCSVSRGIAVGEDGEAIQPSPGRDLRAGQVSRRVPAPAESPAVSNARFSSTREDLGFRWVSEQVSHHPPVSAFQAEGLKDDFIFHGSIYPKLKFWGKSIEAEPKGTITLELPR